MSQDKQACGAKTLDGPCTAPRMTNKKRCFRHGGAPGSGAPKGNQNAYKHGCCTKEALAESKAHQAQFRKAMEDLHAMRSNLSEGAIERIKQSVRARAPGEDEFFCGLDIHGDNF